MENFNFKFPWFVAVLPLVNLIKSELLRIKIYKCVFLIAGTLLNAMLSAHVTFHDEENRPKECGLIVANHSTPFDTCLMSSKSLASFVNMTNQKS